MTKEEKLAEMVDQGPRKGQSKKSLQECLAFAKRMFQERGGSWGGMMRWAPLVAAFEKALGLTPTPKAWLTDQKTGKTKHLDFTTVKVTSKGVALEMKKD